MIFINLKPDLEEVERHWWKKDLFLISIPILIINLFLGYMYYTSENTNETNLQAKKSIRENKVEAKPNKTNKNKKAYVALDNLYKDYSNRLKRFEKLYILEHLLANLPKQMWFKKIESGEENPKVTFIKIYGNSHDYLSVAKFLKEVSISGKFSKSIKKINKKISMVTLNDVRILNKELGQPSNEKEKIGYLITIKFSEINHNYAYKTP